MNDQEYDELEVNRNDIVEYLKPAMRHAYEGRGDVVIELTDGGGYALRSLSSDEVSDREAWLQAFWDMPFFGFPLQRVAFDERPILRVVVDDKVVSQALLRAA